MAVDNLRAWLLTPPTINDIFDPFGMVFLVVFAIGFVACAYAARPSSASPLGDAPATVRGTRWTNAGLGIFTAGLFFFGIRAFQIEDLPFGARIWMVVSALVAAPFVIHCARGWKRAERTTAR